MTNTKMVPTPKLEEYEKIFAEHMSFERKNGILQVRLHTKGDPVRWSFEMHQAMAEAWATIGHDMENEVLILTSTDPYWVGEFEISSFQEGADNPDKNVIFNNTWRCQRKMVYNWINDIDIPTIAAINGPGLHWENAFMSDITLCTPDFVLRDDHFGDATVPGDSQALVIQAICGLKRGNYMMFMANGVDAKTCLDWGLVNEILPKEKLLLRAWEIAEQIMKQPRIIRRITHQLAVRPWKRILHNDFDFQIGVQMYGGELVNMHVHHYDDIKSRLRETDEKRK
jgi:enoyl-CoA hydratase/carnithine racemase